MKIFNELFNWVRALKYGAILIRDFSRTDAVFEIYKLTAYPFGEFLKKKVVDAGFTPKDMTYRTCDIEHLKSLPSNTLGHKLYEFYKKNNCNEKHLHHLLKNSRKVDRMSSHMTAIHDILHVLTGYNTTPIGEACLQAFSISHLRLPATVLIAVGYILGNLHKGNTIKDTKRIIKAYRDGKNAEWLLPVQWDLLLNKDIDELRQQYNIMGVTH